ncbi:unnamed protein product [Penicillium roqueforti FM164]|uniref:Genomic scaffold, ProqFM164S01 n=1 Tax=Penicillium roqueforti (strain FM164) TaxID=1365484 RepID=W6QFW2_PENRF|nr:unnamed protein product [Penicillium roqueforti FM164]
MKLSQLGFACGDAAGQRRRVNDGMGLSVRKELCEDGMVGNVWSSHGVSIILGSNACKL